MYKVEFNLVMSTSQLVDMIECIFDIPHFQQSRNSILTKIKELESKTA